VCWPELSQSFGEFVKSGPFSWHIGVFGVVCLVAFLVFSTKWNLGFWNPCLSLNWRLFWASLVTFLLGIGVELFQLCCMDKGQCDVRDIGLNFVGIAIAVGLAWWASMVLREPRMSERTDSAGPGG